MASKLQQTKTSEFLLSFEDKINALDLQAPTSIDDDIWLLNASDGGTATVDFYDFDKKSLCFTDSTDIHYDKETLSFSPKTLAKILFVGIVSGLSNQRAVSIGAMHSIKMLFYYLTQKKLDSMQANEIEPFFCFYLLNDMEGTELKALISPLSYTNRPILNHLRKIKSTLYRYGINGFIDTLPDSELNSKMNSACEAMLDMTFNDYREGGSFNYLGLDVGKHYVDHCHSFFEEHFLFTSAMEATLQATSKGKWGKTHRMLSAKVLLGLTLSDEKQASLVPLKTRLHCEKLVHDIFRQAYGSNAKLSLLFKLSTVSHFVNLIGLPDRYDAQEFIRSLFLVEIFGRQAGKTKKSIWAEYKAAVKAQSEELLVSLDEFEQHLRDFINKNDCVLPATQESLKHFLKEKTSHLLSVFSLSGALGKKALQLICLKVRQVGALCFLAATGWRRSEFGFTFSDIKIGKNNDGLDNFYIPWRFHIRWMVPKTNGMSKTEREITSTSFILLSQLACFLPNNQDEPLMGSGDFIYEASKLLWSDFIQHYEWFDENVSFAEDNVAAIKEIKYEVRRTFPLYQLANTSGDFKDILKSYRRGSVSEEHRQLLEDNLPQAMLDKLSEPGIEFTSKNVSAIKNALLRDVKYPSSHAFRHMWAEAVLMRYRGPVGSFIRANFQHMDERFFMAYLRDKDMKLINENAERSFISYVSQQYAELGRDAFGESVSQLPRYIELLVSKTSVLSHEKYLKKVATVANERIESVKANPWGTCIRRAGTDFRAACSQGGIPHTHDASPKLCLGCTNVDITKANLRGIMVYTRQEVEVCLNPNLPPQLKMPYIDTIRRAVSAVKKLKARSSNPSRYDKAIADFEKALSAANAYQEGV
ncbi:hypothetical protein DXV75_16160 [Alteromonas aestuariivivens]|uniref:Uncharacterized protein n=1 Tax=Alteromonas aestuariivivens TaxID=1938339 RepID=A0A3D8M2R0_9ALTE|nr:hypothetical protein [Alteromonas aestuariivivens]RDV23993.1 hypothetical protein DXV75_16160 [Alteromonas aestuariivivens]